MTHCAERLTYRGVVEVPHHAAYATEETSTTASGGSPTGTLSTGTSGGSSTGSSLGSSRLSRNGGYFWKCSKKCHDLSVGGWSGSAWGTE